jgi:hypothetical protein
MVMVYVGATLPLVLLIEAADIGFTDAIKASSSPSRWSPASSARWR